MNSIDIYPGSCPKLIARWQFRVRACSWVATVVSVVAPVTEFAIVLYEAKIPTFLGSIQVTSGSSWTHFIVYAISLVSQAFIQTVVPVAFAMMVGPICCGTLVAVAGYMCCLKGDGLHSMDFCTS